jgi:hypothetical protein
MNSPDLLLPATRRRLSRAKSHGVDLPATSRPRDDIVHASRELRKT